MIIDNLSMIVAVDREFGIGKDNDLLCHIDEDLRYFKEVTLEHPIIMGYNTYMSLPIRPLPSRTNIVLTTKDIELEGAVVIHSLEEALNMIQNKYVDEEVFICGGESIYRQFMDYSSKLYITHIFNTFDADTFFPKIDDWEIERTKAKKENILANHPHLFVVYKRKKD